MVLPLVIPDQIGGTTFQNNMKSAHDAETSGAYLKTVSIYPCRLLLSRALALFNHWLTFFGRGRA
jgi:hypothetical protein